MNQPLIMKFGGASVATAEKFKEIADLIVRRKSTHPRIAIVVSAMGGATDQLIKLAEAVHPNPPQREYDMLVSAGERISIALLAMALAKNGIEAVSFTGSQAGIITSEQHTEARILEVRPKRILNALDQNRVVIVAGFQGVSRSNEITTLGRGGSDTSAVALGVALQAPVEFYKDVDGIFNADPKKDSAAVLLKNLSYDEALAIVKKGAKVLHPRCIELASKNRIPLHVRSFTKSTFDWDEGTTIGNGTSINIIDAKYEE